MLSTFIDQVCPQIVTWDLHMFQCPSVCGRCVDHGPEPFMGCQRAILILLCIFFWLPQWRYIVGIFLGVLISFFCLYYLWQSLI